MGRYALERVTRLKEAGILPEIPFKDRKTLTIGENARKYTVEMDKDIVTAAYPIDGVAIKDGNKCDKLVTALKGDDGIAVFVELKGKDINHAIQQLEVTVRHNLFTPFPDKEDRSRARIVTLNCGPSSASRAKFVEAQNRFRKLYNIDLQIRKGTQKDNRIIL